ncbi:MAG TPA: tryptophan 7-halogenase [Acidobacteriaceae bacterium]|nr:tryptophan 7-halogenase [Acidobacteriaceae bacterium]
MNGAPELYDLAIVGSGFAGSLAAMIGRRLGLSVVLLERGRHPRIMIGESSTPLSNLLLEELTTRYRLPQIRPMSKWGSWQRAHPEIACGLKRGFTFYHHSLAHPGPATYPERERQLLVAASPHDDIADTHWFRSDFDQFLVEAAVKAGADYYDQIHLKRFTDCGSHVLLEGCRKEPPPEPPYPPRPCAFRARFVIDATGPRGFLFHALKLAELPLPGMPPTQALYSHFCGVARLADAQKTTDPSPYPPDDAAVHHIFPGGWIWVLRFNNGYTSAGAALTDETAARFGLSHAAGGADAQPRYAAAWNQLLAQIPVLQAQFSRARLPRTTYPFTHIPRLSFRAAQTVGHRWAMLPSAAGFVDPLLSTGFPLALLGLQRLAAILEPGLDDPDLDDRLATYAAQTDADLLAATRLIAALYATMDNFPAFTALTMLYFAAVSYSEAARRLGKPDLAGSFLLHDHPHFGPAMRHLLDQAATIRTPEQAAHLAEQVRRAIEPINVAGLADSARHNWYPLLADDLLINADKLHASRTDIEAMFDRCGFRQNSVVS